MAITPPYNDIEMKTAWAEDAATTIPSVPVPGISYRNTGISEETIANGQAYDNIGRSADWNQLLYKISANIVTMQKQGASLLWVSGRNYEQGALVKDPNNAQIYYRLKAGAGTTRPSSDSTNWQLLQSFFMGEGLELVSNKITWGAPNTDKTDPNSLKTAGVYWFNNQTTNTPTDIENSNKQFTGFIVVIRRGTTVFQIAYEVNGFSFNTRRSTNTGSTWSAWTRFGVEFTLDWRSGGDYRVGDLVRDTSNNLLYVCTTAITNSTNRPGLDTGHFTLLQSYLAGEGLEVRDNKITWGVSGAYLQNIDVATIIKAGAYRIGVTGVENAAFGGNHSMIVLKFVNDQVLQLAFISANRLGPVAVRGITSINSTPTVGVWNYSSAFDSLDFISGRTYDIGQLVRGSNNVHYVKKTASSVCTTEPNADSTNFESLASNIGGDGLRIVNNKITFGYAISSATDLNSAIAVGTYSFGGNATNNPSTSKTAGTLLVIASGGNAESRYFTQVTYHYNGESYLRTYDSDANPASFSSWTKIGPADEVSAADLAGNGLTAASNKLNWGTASNVTNANSVTTPGTYALTSSSTNVPIQGGIMFVVKNSSGKVCQLIFNPATGGIYQRDNTSGSWSTWYNQTNSVGANMNAQANRSFGTTYTAETDGFIELTAYSNWRANTNGQLYINGNEIAVNHTGQYGSGGQSSGVQTTIYVRAGDQYRCNQGSLEYYRWYPNN